MRNGLEAGVPHELDPAGLVGLELGDQLLVHLHQNLLGVRLKVQNKLNECRVDETFHKNNENIDYPDINLYIILLDEN